MKESQISLLKNESSKGLLSQSPHINQQQYQSTTSIASSTASRKLKKISKLPLAEQLRRSRESKEAKDIIMRQMS